MKRKCKVECKKSPIIAAARFADGESNIAANFVCPIAFPAENIAPRICAAYRFFKVLLAAHADLCYNIYIHYIHIQNLYIHIQNIKFCNAENDMKVFTCEMCGGHELKKEDGVFVCQHCHTKYAPEDAQKLILDGPIEIDNTRKLDNLFILARRARDDNDAEGARRYYEMILLEAPQNWEAAFYALFFGAKDSTVPDIPYTAQKAADGIDSVLALVHAQDDTDAERAALTEIVTRMDELAVLMFNVAQLKCKETLAKNPSAANAANDMVRRCDAALRMMYTLGDEIHRQFDGAFDSIAAVAWKSGVNMHLLLLPSLRRRAENIETLKYYADRIRTQEPGFALPDLQRARLLYRNCRIRFLRLPRRLDAAPLSRRAAFQNGARAACHPHLLCGKSRACRAARALQAAVRVGTAHAGRQGIAAA